MTRPVFVDTSAWLAAIDRKDRSHKAVRSWIEANRSRRLITTSFILDESLTLIARRLDHEKASQFGNAVFDSNVAQLVYVDHKDIESAWQIFQKYSDQDFSFTDCTSFAVMNRLDLTEALAIDQHFEVIGFALVV